MTGICGIVNLDGGRVDPEAICVMVGAAAHRAPDGSHSWLSQNAALAHLALKLTPEEQQERQPVAEGDLVVSADARIDNRAELIAQLSPDFSQRVGAAGSLAVGDGLDSSAADRGREGRWLRRILGERWRPEGSAIGAVC